MRNHYLPPLQKLRQFEPYLYVCSGIIIALGVWGGWAGNAWPWVLLIYLLRFPKDLVLEQMRKRGVSSVILIVIMATSNYFAVLIIIFLTGGQPNPFWLLFLVEAVASAAYRAIQGIFTYSLSALLFLIWHQVKHGPDWSSILYGGIYISIALFIGLATYQALEMLYQEHENREKVEEDLRNSLREKEALLKEIHHRVKNNLQVISSLLNLQSQTIEDKTTLSAFRESQDRVRSMALIHEKLYQSQNLAEIDFCQYVHHLSAYLFRSYRNNSADIKLHIQCDPILLDIDTSVPCGLIINECISNALKHAFPDNHSGDIWVEMSRQQNNRVSLIVADNGIGLPASLDPFSAPSLGLQLVSTLVSQLNGELQYKNSSGTRIEISFQPLHPHGD